VPHWTVRARSQRALKTAGRAALDPSLWQRAFTRQALERGLRIADAGRVLDLAERGLRPLLLIAEVQGSRPEPYRTELTVHSDGRVESRCTCPAGSLCEHAAAALVHYTGFTGIAPLAEEAEEPVERRLILPWERWLEALAEPGRGGETAADQVFGLLLKAGDYGQPPQLWVAPVWFRVGTRGGLIEPQSPVLRAPEPVPAPEGGWPEETVDALALLLERAAEKSGKVAFAPINDRAAERAFLRLLAHAPAYWRRADGGALTLAPPAPPRLAWTLDADGSQRLRIALPEPEGLVLRGCSLWYLLPESGRLGRIEGDPAWLARALEAPPLRPELVGSVSALIGERAAGLPLPPPLPAPPLTRIEAAPRPLLLLDALAVGVGEEERRIGRARLRFDYGGFEVAPEDPPAPRRMAGDELLEIRRDRAAEAQFAARLGALGLRRGSELGNDGELLLAALDDADYVLRSAPDRAPEPPAGWRAVLERLAAEGFALRFSESFPKPRRRVAAGPITVRWRSLGILDELSLSLDVEGRPVPLAPALLSLLHDPDFPLRPRPRERRDALWTVAIDEGREVELPLSQLRALIDRLAEHLPEHRPDGSLRIHPSSELDLGALDFLAGEPTRPVRIPRRLELPARFAAILRPYQRKGAAWLLERAALGFGALLADDMGLGKTVQVLALLAAEKAARPSFRSLVVMPTSLIGHWQEEAARFAPELRRLLLHGPQRFARFSEIGAHDLILTTYPLLVRDREVLAGESFHLIVLDEAQAIKNPESQAARAVRQIASERRLALTGTPIENHLGELWALFDAIEPGLLGDAESFERVFRIPIEQRADEAAQARLKRRIAPLVLRRRKEEVLADLPEKTEILQTLELEESQRALYERLRAEQQERVRAAIAERGLAQSGMVVLDALLKLRQVCCDPRLLPAELAAGEIPSAKLEAALELVEALIAEGRRVLLFSQFARMLELIGQSLRERRIRYLVLTGETPAAARPELVRRFQAGEVALFMVSLRAGGVGLTLTAADSVIHYDPWWNPAVEEQATDRAHRIGQDKPVFVYRLICRGTVEERIQALKARKAELAASLLSGEGNGGMPELSEEDLAELFAPLGNGNGS
jgi:superfamily II DNA or RNA helicase